MSDDLYLEPSVEVDHQMIDPMDNTLSDIVVKVIIVGPGGSVCSPGGC
jgi:hypothetical protein